MSPQPLPSPELVTKRWETRDACPPGPNSFIFMQFSAKTRRPLRKILDPPLKGRFKVSCPPLPRRLSCCWTRYCICSFEGKSGWLFHLSLCKKTSFDLLKWVQNGRNLHVRNNDSFRDSKFCPLIEAHSFCNAFKMLSQRWLERQYFHSKIHVTWSYDVVTVKPCFHWVSVSDDTSPETWNGSGSHFQASLQVSVCLNKAIENFYTLSKRQHYL